MNVLIGIREVEIGRQSLTSMILKYSPMPLFIFGGPCDNAEGSNKKIKVFSDFTVDILTGHSCIYTRPIAALSCNPPKTDLARRRSYKLQVAVSRMSCASNDAKRGFTAEG